MMINEKIRQLTSEARALQRQLQTITDSAERKQMARKMNSLFSEASTLRKQAKHRHYLEKCIEREFMGIKANLEDD